MRESVSLFVNRLQATVFVLRAPFLTFIAAVVFQAMTKIYMHIPAALAVGLWGTNSGDQLIGDAERDIP